MVAGPKKRPKSSYVRFAADQPNECWQADFTHYRRTRPDGGPGRNTEIPSWLDDHSRYALSVTAHHRVTDLIVVATFGQTVATHGIPATIYTSRPKATAGDRTGDTHDRVRHDQGDTSGKITLRCQGQLDSIGIGRTHHYRVRPSGMP